MPLSVKDGMGAWIKDFQKSDASQFKGKSDKERREMAMAAYLSAKRDAKNEGYVSAAQRKAVHATKADGGKGHPDNKKEEVKLPFTPDPPKPEAKNSDGTKTSPMSRARQLAKKARDAGKSKNEGYSNDDYKAGNKTVKVKSGDRAGETGRVTGRHWIDGKMHFTIHHGGDGRERNSSMHPGSNLKIHRESVEESYNWKVSHAGKDVHVKAPHAGAAVKKAQRGFGNMDLTKAKVSNLGKVGAPTNEDNQIDELSNDTLRSYHAKAATDLKKKKDQVTKGQLTQKDFKKGQNRVTGLNRAAYKMESVELEEMYASTTEPHKDGHRSKVVKTQPNGKTTMSYLGQHVYKSKEHARNAADHIANGMRKGRASDSYIQDFARRHHKEHGMKESTQIDEVGRMSPKVGKASYTAPAKELKAYAQKSGGIDKKDFMVIADMLEKLDRINILQAGQLLGQLSAKLKNMDTSPREKVLSVLHKHGHNVGNFVPGAKMRRESVDEAFYGTQAQRLMSPLQKARQDKEKADRDRDGKLKSTALPMRKKNEETVSELKKSTLGSYVKKAAQDAGAKAYSAAQKATSNPDQSGKDYVKSVKRQKGIARATDKLANEAKSFDQKFKDHLKFATSKSPAVQAYMKKRAADRDAMNKKNDPNAAKKGYALTAVPPERKYQKLQKAKKAGKA